MLHKCANPTCSNPFRKLSEGKLFLVEMKSPSTSAATNWENGKPPRIEHFWLCDCCATVLTLSFEKGRGMVTVPLPEIKKQPAPVRLAESASPPAYTEEQSRIRSA